MNNKIVIGLLAMTLSGKDTIADYLVKKYKFKRIAFADELKQDISKMEGISIEEIEQKKEIHRNLLISYGENKRKEDPLYWINRTIKSNNIDFDNLDQNLVISDVRRIDELKWLKKLKDKYNNIYVIEVIKPEHWDDDIETIKSIVYGNYFNCFYCRLINAGTKQDLYDTIDHILTKIYLTMNIDE